MQHINAVKDENWPVIRMFLNVNGVRAGKKITKGVVTDEDAVHVFVTKKLPTTELKKKDIVPERIDGIKTDIIQVGEIWALSCLPIPKAITTTGIDRTKKFDPVLGGISTGHPNITAGTLSIAQETDQGIFYLSNAHVFSDCNDGIKGDLLCQPGKYDDPTYHLNYFAELYQWVPIHFEGENGGGQCQTTDRILSFLNAMARFKGSYQRFYSKNIRAEDKNYVDAAIAKPYLDYRKYDALNILEVGKVMGIEDPVLGMKSEKSGRTSAVNDGTVNGLDVTVTVNYGDKGISTFYKQGTTTPMLSGGDSGSLILNKDNLKAVGLGFAGSDQISIFGLIGIVWESFKLNPVFPK